MITINRSDHINLDEAINLLTDDSIVLTQGEDKYKSGLKILYKLLGVTARKDRKGDRKDPFDRIVKSMKGILHV